MKKINKERLMILITFILSLTVILADFITLTIATFKGNMAGWTWFGMITFIASGIFLSYSADYIKDSIKKEK